ncbi:MAG: hypothetical protein KDD61_17035 [Bdellovibrionales bacterium]|nr:hypothetical protein [Bdellovibrionales bacterium]
MIRTEMRKSRKIHEIVTGHIVVSARDTDGSILAIDLITSNGKNYLIADNPKGEQLIRHVGSKVTLHGDVEKNSFGTIIEVQEYEVFI